ncbi:MAG: nucleotidyltransferase family protein [Candidatus Latescibacterota bacterium]|jgi:hypothetical protein
MTDAQQILERLQQLKPVAMQRYRVRNLALFGSIARGTSSAQSDVDILADFEETADLLDLVGLGNFLEDELARKVDVVPRRALRPELRDQVLAESVAL